MSESPITSTVKTNDSSETSFPPMLLHYRELKQQFTDTFLFYQVGDFYELFFEDARQVSRLLNLTLTSRDRNNPNPVPMCGVPIAAVEGYIDRLVQTGCSVAVASQTSGTLDPEVKGFVERRVERVITPGIRLLSGIEREQSEDLVLAVFPDQSGEVSLAFCGVQKGAIRTREGLPMDELKAEVLRLAPAEIIIPRSVGEAQIDGRVGWVRSLAAAVGEQRVKFRSESSASFASTRSFSALKGYPGLTPLGRRSVRLLIRYIDESMAGLMINLFEVVPDRPDSGMVIEGSTRRNLELLKNARDGGIDGTLFGYLRETITSGGQRMLRSWIGCPLLSINDIEHRYEVVGTFITHFGERSDLRGLLSKCGDLERISARLELLVAGPRELATVRNSLTAAAEASMIIEKLQSRPTLLADIAERLLSPVELRELLERALADFPPMAPGDGSVFRPGFDERLDGLRNLSRGGQELILAYEADERARTGISSLKVRTNNVLGYYIEITKTHLTKVPDDYRRRQSMVQAERFVTDQLIKLERELSGAESRLVDLERRLFDELRQTVAIAAPTLRRIGEALSELDCLAAFAEIAERDQLIRAELRNEPVLDIVAGRHPMLARKLGNGCVPNSLALQGDARRAALITGPNMGGKSTFLRQTGLITVMAQIGCFVPAERAVVGIVDRLFARLGASDDLTEGDSTFMVEMREASQIVARATERSMLLIDEIGRGTSTRDGLAIAQAILEWLILRSKSRMLFATHFHELTALANEYEQVSNLSVGAVEDGNGVVFTHEIHEGPARQSYGIEVAKLAGLPVELLSRATVLLAVKRDTIEVASPQLSLFGSPIAVEREGDPFVRFEKLACSEGSTDPLIAAIRLIEPDELTPRQALETLYRLVALEKGESDEEHSARKTANE